MIGRAPMMSAPVYPPSYPATSYPAPGYAAQPGWPQQYSQPYAEQWPQQPTAPAPAQWPQGTSAPEPQWAQPAAPQPIFRGKGPDDPPLPAVEVPSVPVAVEAAPVPLSIPSPDQLGVSLQPADASRTDWGAVRQRLSELGVVSFHVEQLPQSGCKFSCFLPSGQPGRSHRIEAVANTEAEALRLATAKAEEWLAGR